MVIFLIINKNQNIIRDTGILKCHLFYIGMMMFFISLNFNTFINFSNCAINFALKHSSIFMIYMVLLIFIFSGYKLGMDHKKLERLNLKIFKGNGIQDKDSLNEKTFTATLNQEVIKNIEKELNFLGIYNSEYFNSNKSLGDSKENYDSENIETIKLNKSISYIHSLCTESIYIFIITILIIGASIILYSKYETQYIQEYNYKWRYKCPLSRFDLILNLIEFIFILYLAAIVIKIWNYTYVFKFLKNLNYAVIVWVTLGPLVNVI